MLAPASSAERQVRARARRYAAALAEAGLSKSERGPMAVVAATAEAVSELAAGGGRSAGRLLDASSRLTGHSRPALTMLVARLALRDLDRLALPPRQAVRAQLRIVAALAPLREVSLWSREQAGRLRCLDHVRGRPTRGVRTVAAGVLAGGEATPAPPGSRRTLLAVPVGADRSPAAALAARTAAGSAGPSLALLAEATPLLAATIERESLLEAGDRRVAKVTSAAERRLARVGLDLHDGPAQEVAMLVGDIQLFGGQLEAALSEGPLVEVLEGRVEDLEARALAVSTEIRDVARMTHSPVSQRETVGEVLRAEVNAFARATGVQPKLEVKGPVDVLTASQRIALLRGVQEALRNAREHAQAQAVSVRVVALKGRIEAQVRDDGRGFDPERTLSTSGGAGRLGLVGIAERARLLGGRCDVRSRPGGPTTVTISLPRWDPRHHPATRGE